MITLLISFFSFAAVEPCAGARLAYKFQVKLRQLGRGGQPIGPNYKASCTHPVGSRPESRLNTGAEDTTRLALGELYKLRTHCTCSFQPRRVRNCILESHALGRPRAQDTRRWRDKRQGPAREAADQGGTARHSPSRGRVGQWIARLALVDGSQQGGQHQGGARCYQPLNPTYNLLTKSPGPPSKP